MRQAPGLGCRSCRTSRSVAVVRLGNEVERNGASFLYAFPLQPLNSFVVESKAWRINQPVQVWSCDDKEVGRIRRQRKGRDVPHDQAEVLLDIGELIAKG